MCDRNGLRLSRFQSVTGLFWILALITICFGFDEIGILTPRDSDYLVGSNVTLQCSLFDSYIKVNDVNLKSPNISVNSSNLVIHTQYGEHLPSTILSDSEIQYSIVNGGVNDSLFYYCKLKVQNSLIFVHLSIIRFGYPPYNVLNFKCRSIEYKNLTCWWTSPPNTLTVNYTLKRNVYGSVINICPEMLSRTSCRYSMVLKPNYIRADSTLHMELFGQNSLGNHSQLFKLNHFELVVPGPVRNLTVNLTEADSMTLWWISPEGMEEGSFRPGLCYRLLYNVFNETILKIDDVGKNKQNYVLRNLIPNTEYVLRLQGRSCVASPLEYDLWSPNVTLRMRTESDVPWSPPEASNTLFDVRTFHNHTNITIYWKPISKAYHNAGGFYYSVTCIQTHENRVRPDLFCGKERTLKPQYTFVNLETDSSYEFQIHSVNVMGTSSNSTRILVGATDKMPSRPTRVWPISKGNRSYTVSWSSNSNAVNGYTLVWCQRDRPGEYRCDQYIDWIHLPQNTTSMDLQLAENYYDFAVATSSTDNLGSGLRWASCTVHINKVLDKIRQVSIIAESPRTLNVSWKLDCEVQKAVILEYHIYICPTTCPARSCIASGVGPLKVKDRQAETVQVSHLQPFTSYGVSVATVTAAGQSEEGHVECHMTLAEAPSDPPQDVHIQRVMDTSTVNLSWKAPKHPNGIVTRYDIYYNDQKKEMLVPKNTNHSVYMNTTLEGLHYFTNYSVKISACVNTLCSIVSNAQNIVTNIGVPGLMDPPWTEYLNISHVLVKWKSPDLANGPLDYYLVHISLQDRDNLTKWNRLTVTGTSIAIPQKCPTDGQKDKPHHLKIQAVNVLNDTDALYGPLSVDSKNKLCLDDTGFNDYTLIIGTIVGCTFGLAAFVLMLYAYLRWMKSRVKMMNDIKVQLPSGLETPYSNTLNPYEIFTGNMKGKSSNPDLSRTDSFPDLNSDLKNRHGSGVSHFSTASTEELLSKSLGGIQPTPKSSPSVVTTSTKLGSSSNGSTGSGLFPFSAGAETVSIPVFPSPSNPNSVMDDMKVSNSLPMASYSQLALSDPGYLPISKSGQSVFYGHNLVNGELESRDNYLPMEPPSPDVPYSKLGLTLSETDPIIEHGSEYLESPTPQPYSRFAQLESPERNQNVIVGVALLPDLTKDSQEPMQFVDKYGPKTKPSDEAYSKLGLDPTLKPKTSGYVTIKDINKSEKKLPPYLKVSALKESPALVSSTSTEVPNCKNGYLPYQPTPTAKEKVVRPPVKNGSSVVPSLQAIPEVEVQGNSGYVTLNQVTPQFSHLES